MQDTLILAYILTTLPSLWLSYRALDGLDEAVENSRLGFSVFALFAVFTPVLNIVIAVNYIKEALDDYEE